MVSGIDCEQPLSCSKVRKVSVESNEKMPSECDTRAAGSLSYNSSPSLVLGTGAYQPGAYPGSVA